MSQQVASLFPAGAGPVPGSVHEQYVAERLTEVGKFGTETLADCVRRHAAERGDRPAYSAAGGLSVTWSELDDLSGRLAALLVSLGIGTGDRVAVFYPDGPVVHALYLATEKAGAISMGIGPRAGQLEMRHLLSLSGADTLVTAPRHKGEDMTELVARLRDGGLPLRHHLVIDPESPDLVTVNGAAPAEIDGAERRRLLAGRALGLGDIFLLNSTSGTTGMPKCVVHHQNRWRYFHSQVLRAAEFSADDTWLSLIPSPYGFGIWTAHATPILLGAHTVMMPKFDAGQAVRLIDSEQATVMAGVTTQFIMMLNAPEMADADLGSLRCLFTGGEAIPYARAEQFEKRTGAAVLNFYGSNETGMLSYTTAADSTERRLGTTGHVVEDLRVRLFDDAFDEIPAAAGIPGQSGCRGPSTSLGYYADPEANRKLFSPDGWMLTGDLCLIDADGYLTVVGRTSDFIIRGGKNISAAAVEEQVGSHPAVALVAAVGVPDEVFGERVCVVVELHDGATLQLPELLAHLESRGVSKDSWPERLEIVDAIPQSSGGKVAKGQLRKQYGAAG
ncbi:class I adenylate-forming enzyme family protein [Nakamurella lactea]|uniref:class I adenylate-forming enzyme family protein n=1 Tax=Nakamurella lactea TaxID=459515 RepID=UPI0003F740AB|nr:class I adenylate-forming enzyme family protein [Nakamurella lactea]